MKTSHIYGWKHRYFPVSKMGRYIAKVDGELFPVFSHFGESLYDFYQRINKNKKIKIGLKQ